jgi:hypothetical protein
MQDESVNHKSSSPYRQLKNKLTTFKILLTII